jgi:hypothetical protein
MIGNISKMKTTLGNAENSCMVQYQLPVGDDLLPMNEHIGEGVRLNYQGEIHCISCGRKTSKSFAQGHCYPCFRSLAACDICIMKPETCHFAEGTCREPDWAKAHCFIPHYVYLANSSGLKVGITRETQIPVRWMDQGATQALPVIQVENRLQSGLIEVVIKEHISDRTDWRKMLKSDAEPLPLETLRDELLDICSTEIAEIKKQQGEYAIQTVKENIVEIRYPVSEYPAKVKSLNFDKQPEIEGVLMGIKGQYLILDTGVLNMRKFAGYNIEVEFV